MSALPEADAFALAGGAALVVSRVVDRTTKDLDFFGPSADDVQQLVEALDAALSQAGLTVHRERPRLSLEELAADKLLALFDSAQARDFVDVAALAERLGFDRLCQLAKEKYAGFSPQVLRDMLGGFHRFDRTDFGLDETAYSQLAQHVTRWRAALALHLSPTTEPPSQGPRSASDTTDFACRLAPHC